ncbi:MAG: 4-hydroxy-tetrahydrodipicolinate reductase [Clostridiales bacterium]|nr:4-hydroxy-tetrahydrodipicolinate reductase [Clostridiales bacterium]MCF8022196.1 4-hydroxy-tetrahydrodipicolinate reductase [Clostridiales bacterium]
MIKVIVTGAAGRMGKEVVKAVQRENDIEIVGAVDQQFIGYDIGILMGQERIGVTLQDNLENAINISCPDVVVDFTNSDSVISNIFIALKHNVKPVIGTTGMSSDEIESIRNECKNKKIGCIIAANFAIGALLMMRFTQEAVKYFPNVEIIEQHHDQKIDAPSGTAIKTAELLSENRGEFQQGLPTEVEKIPGSRGGEFNGGVRIHSVRLPGLVAHQEVILGGLGQTLKIRHDSITRESFMPGVIVAIKKVGNIEEMVYGLEKILFED